MEYTQHTYMYHVQGAEHTVNAGNYYFSPDTLVIGQGDIVYFVNDAGYHDATFETNSITGESFNNPENLGILPASSGPSNMGQLTFNTVGDYSYDCSIGNHALQGMVGTITVEAAAAEGVGCMQEGASNYDPAATVQEVDIYENWVCSFASCSSAPTGGCLWPGNPQPTHYGPPGYSAADCEYWGGTPCGGSYSSAQSYRIN